MVECLSLRHDRKGKPVWKRQMQLLSKSLRLFIDTPRWPLFFVGKSRGFLIGWSFLGFGNASVVFGPGELRGSSLEKTMCSSDPPCKYKRTGCTQQWRWVVGSTLFFLSHLRWWVWLLLAFSTFSLWGVHFFYSWGKAMTTQLSTVSFLSTR